jgi:nucleoside 2-deoxyribosyltransferase
MASSMHASGGNSVFIAMAFTDDQGQNVTSDLRDTIRNCCEDLGWDPIIVDEVQHNDGIMDKVIAEINNARFVISDLTYQKSGVYYEAGYAKGRGLEVIHCVKQDDLSNCHFDVKHLNLVVWNDLEELREKLMNRIQATVGVKN